MSHDSINPLICISPHANTKNNTLVDIIRTNLHFPDHTSRTIIIRTLDTLPLYRPSIHCESMLAFTPHSFETST